MTTPAVPPTPREALEALDEAESAFGVYDWFDAIRAALESAAAESERPHYPDTINGQRVMQPSASVRVVVTPSGFGERIYDGKLGEYERLVTYVLAAAAFCEKEMATK